MAREGLRWTVRATIDGDDVEESISNENSPFDIFLDINVPF
jgi:hypothetical protein